MGSVRIFMVVEPEPDNLATINEAIRTAQQNSQIFHAKDGYEALLKMKNVTPDVLVTGLKLHKHFSGYKLVEDALKEKALDKMNIIVTDEAPEEDFCVDEVFCGRLQFVKRPLQLEPLVRAAKKALEDPVAPSQAEIKVKLIVAGEVLCREGEKAISAYLLKSGRLQASKKFGSELKILGEILPGEFVGEMAYTNGEPRSADVVAIENSELIEIRLEALDSIIFKNPAWAKALMKTLSTRLKAANAGKKG